MLTIINGQQIMKQRGLRALWWMNYGHLQVTPLYFLHLTRGLTSEMQHVQTLKRRGQRSGNGEAGLQAGLRCLLPLEQAQSPQAEMQILALARHAAVLPAAEVDRGGAMILLISMDQLRGER